MHLFCQNMSPKRFSCHEVLLNQLGEAEIPIRSAHSQLKQIKVSTTLTKVDRLQLSTVQ